MWSKVCQLPNLLTSWTHCYSFCRKTTLTKHQRRTHRLEGGSPASSSGMSDSEGEDTEDAPQDHEDAQRFQPPHTWPSMRDPYAAVPTAVPHRTHSLTTLAIKTEPGQVYTALSQNGHRYSFPDTMDFGRNGTVNAPSHQYHHPSNQPIPPQTHNYQPAQLEAHSGLPVTVKTELSPMAASNSSLTSAHIHSSPSSLSAESSQDETLQAHEAYYANAHVHHSMHQYQNFSQSMQPSVQYQQYQQSHVPTNVQVPRQPMIAQSPIQVQQHYQVPTPIQATEIYYDSIPYQEPTLVTQPPQTYNLVPYAGPISVINDPYKADDFAMAQNFETMTPSMRAMHGMTH